MPRKRLLRNSCDRRLSSVSVFHLLQALKLEESWKSVPYAIYMLAMRRVHGAVFTLAHLPVNKVDLLS